MSNGPGFGAGAEPVPGRRPSAERA